MKRIYFLRRSDGTGPVKIGCSDYPADRRRQICFDLRAEFVLLATAPGDFLTERNLHLKFAANRVEAPQPTKSRRQSPVPGVSEWFEATPELMHFIEEVRQTDSIPLADNECRERVFAERYLAGDTLKQIGDDFGLTRERVRQVLRRIGVESLGLREQHKARHETTPAETAAVQAYVAGTRPKDIKAKFGLTYSQLRAALIRAGIKRKPPGNWRDPEADALTEKVAFLYRRGLTAVEIAEKLGLPYATGVYRHLKRANVPARRRGRRLKKEAA